MRGQGYDTAPRREVYRLIAILAPEQPPCFEGRHQWVSYLQVAADAQRNERPGPLDMRQGVAKFNRQWNYCEDCTAQHALRMHNAGRCVPDFVSRERV